MTDISREACEHIARTLHRFAKPFGLPSTEGLMILALRDALVDVRGIIVGKEVVNG